jgi:hypothetical protein
MTEKDPLDQGKSLKRKKYEKELRRLQGELCRLQAKRRLQIFPGGKSLRTRG